MLLGEYPGPIPRGLALEEQNLPYDDPAGLPVELLQRRPDLVAAEEVLHAETARVGVAEADRYPAVSLSGSISTIADQASDIGTKESKAFNLAAAFFQPLFDSGQLKARSQAQRARAEQALHSYVLALQRALLLAAALERDRRNVGDEGTRWRW